jgi:hypothetical protein
MASSGRWAETAECSSLLAVAPGRRVDRHGRGRALVVCHEIRQGNGTASYRQPAGANEEGATPTLSSGRGSTPLEHLRQVDPHSSIFPFHWIREAARLRPVSSYMRPVSFVNRVISLTQTQFSLLGPDP